MGYGKYSHLGDPKCASLAIVYLIKLYRCHHGSRGRRRRCPEQKPYYDDSGGGHRLPRRRDTDRFRELCQEEAVGEARVYMYGLLHAKAIKLDLINFEHPGYYDCLSRAISEAPWRPNNILNNIVSMFRGLLSLVLMAGLLFTLHWAVALVLVAVNIPGIWLRLHYADILYNFQRDQTPEARKSTYFNWLLTGERPSRELRLFGLGEYFTALFRRSFLRQKDQETDIIRRRTRIELISNVVKAAALLGILLFIARETSSGNLSLGQMAMFLLAFRQGMTYIKTCSLLLPACTRTASLSAISLNTSNWKTR